MADPYPRKLGVGVPPRGGTGKYFPDAEVWRRLEMLQPDWWYDWGWRTRTRKDPHGRTISRWPTNSRWAANYTPMMWASYEGPTDLHGRAILALNEPDLPNQANKTPDQGKAAVDRLVSGGASQFMTPGIILYNSEEYPYGWITRYVEHGGRIPAAWHVHVYDVACFEDYERRIMKFREWMNRRGVARPIFVSETNCQGLHPREHVEYLSCIINDLKKPQPVAETVAWFSTYYQDANGPRNSNLFDAAGNLTWVGDVFAHYGR